MSQMSHSDLPEAAQVKRIEEEICEQNIEGLSIGWCGDLANTQCGSCTKFICAEHAQTCRNCRDHGKHYLYCPNCKNTHKCPGEVAL